MVNWDSSTSKCALSTSTRFISLSCILIKHCKNKSYIDICFMFHELFMYSYILYSCLVKQQICDANKFGSIIIFWKCKFDEGVLKNYIGVNSFQHRIYLKVFILK